MQLATSLGRTAGFPLFGQSSMAVYAGKPSMAGYAPGGYPLLGFHPSHQPAMPSYGIPNQMGQMGFFSNAMSNIITIASAITIKLAGKN
jgi:hypothetical protein